MIHMQHYNTHRDDDVKFDISYNQCHFSKVVNFENPFFESVLFKSLFPPLRLGGRHYQCQGCAVGNPLYCLPQDCLLVCNNWYLYKSFFFFFRHYINLYHENWGFIPIQLSLWVPNSTLRAPLLQPNWADAIKGRLVWKGGRNSRQFLLPVNLQTAHLALSRLAQLAQLVHTNIQASACNPTYWAHIDSRSHLPTFTKPSSSALLSSKYMGLEV